MRAVNLLPRGEQRTRLQGKRTPLLVVVGGVAAATAGAAMLAFTASGAADDRRAELAEVEASIARLPKVHEPAVSQSALTQERSDRIAALSAALSTRISFDRLLREISLVLPEDTWLTGLQAASPASLAPAPARSGSAPPPASSSALEGVTIQGATYSHASVARLLSRLSVVPSLENVRLTASARVEPQAIETQGPDGQPVTPRKKGRTVVTFTITASLRTVSPS